MLLGLAKSSAWCFQFFKSDCKSFLKVFVGVFKRKSKMGYFLDKDDEQTFWYRLASLSLILYQIRFLITDPPEIFLDNGSFLKPPIGSSLARIVLLQWQQRVLVSQCVDVITVICDSIRMFIFIAQTKE